MSYIVHVDCCGLSTIVIKKIIIIIIYWMLSSDQILTENDHSRSFKVTSFGVNEEPLRGYIVQYNNNCGLECEGSEDI